VNDEATGTGDKVVDVGWLNLKAVDLFLVSGPECSEIDPVYFKFQFVSPHFTQSLQNDFCCLSTIHWGLSVNEGQVG